MLKVISQLFSRINTNEQNVSPVSDPTMYQVETILNNYCGQILFQDDVQMKMKVVGHRPVKVLKQNIQRISIVKENQSKVTMETEYGNNRKV